MLQTPQHLRLRSLGACLTYERVLAGVCGDLPDRVWKALQRRLDLELVSLPSLRGSMQAKDVHDAQGNAGKGEDGAEPRDGQHNARHNAREAASGDARETTTLEAWQDWYAGMDDSDQVGDLQPRHSVVGMQPLAAVEHRMCQSVEQMSLSVAQEMPLEMQDTEAMQDTEQFYMELDELPQLPEARLAPDDALAPEAASDFVGDGEEDAHRSLAAAHTSLAHLSLAAVESPEGTCCRPSATGDEEQYRELARGEDELCDGLPLLPWPRPKATKKKGKHREF